MSTWTISSWQVRKVSGTALRAWIDLLDILRLNPMLDQEAVTVACAFYSNWILCFGAPLQIKTDQGRQFESQLFRELNRLTGTSHFRTTPYHPAANGMLERRQLKAAIKCHNNSRWIIKWCYAVLVYETTTRAHEHVAANVRYKTWNQINRRVQGLTND